MFDCHSLCEILSQFSHFWSRFYAISLPWILEYVNKCTGTGRQPSSKVNEWFWFEIRIFIFNFSHEAHRSCKSSRGSIQQIRNSNVLGIWHLRIKWIAIHLPNLYFLVIQWFIVDFLLSNQIYLFYLFLFRKFLL